MTTRTEMITRLCEIVADLEDMNQLPFVSGSEKRHLTEIETRIQVFLRRLQEQQK